MGTRKFIVRHNDSEFDIDYDTGDGLEVFQFQLFSITAIPPDQQKIIGADDNRVVSEDNDLTSICDRLRLVVIGGDEVRNSAPESSTDKGELVVDGTMSDEELARLLQAEEEALLLQQAVAHEDKQLVEQKIRPYIHQVSMYEDPIRQKAARETVPMDTLEEQALVFLAKEGNFEPSTDEKEHAFLLQLLSWFKKSFSWVHAPSCENCGSETSNQGMGMPLQSEARYGGSRVELYRCKSCSSITRFPRYNDPMKLLETRKGRCGEWANCFALYCRAFHYETRLILDFTDHVWVECNMKHLGRWMHLDPCEGIYDKPLLYEKGWGKKLNYVFAIAKDGVYDVTKRYTRKWPEVLSRRDISTEFNLGKILADLTKQCRRGLSPDVISVMEKQDRNEREILERDLYSKEPVSTLPGRQSGDMEWRILRSEYGSGSNITLNSVSCPVRLCVDRHVTQIYNALGSVFSNFAEFNIPATKAVEVLEFLKDIFINLRKKPFRSRRVSVQFGASDLFMHQVLPSFDDLLKVLNLKYELVGEARMDVKLAGDPVKTALCLPVALDAVDDMIRSLGQYLTINEDALALPLIRLNRVHSGTVLASGEEPPLGVATSAFDGIRESKWEEPNGAKGCWIVYKLPDKLKQELVAYELMSANDAPERDPKEWVLEGSDNEGTSWYILDQQTCQKFEKRFQRKTYKIGSIGVLANMFRFKFVSAWDSDSTSRLQIGAIDLYAKEVDSA